MVSIATTIESNKIGVKSATCEKVLGKTELPSSLLTYDRFAVVRVNRVIAVRDVPAHPGRDFEALPLGRSPKRGELMGRIETLKILVQHEVVIRAREVFPPEAYELRVSVGGFGSVD
jgi:hypothetical protein